MPGLPATAKHGVEGATFVEANDGRVARVEQMAGLTVVAGR